MNRSSIWMFPVLRAAAFAVAASAFIGAPSEAQQNTTFVFTHANVVPMNTEVVLRDQNVVVQNDTIAAVGPSASVRIPPGATVIDASSKYLMPALSDMHVHLEGDAWNIMYPKGKGFTSSEIDFNDILYIYIANGITMIDVLFAFPEHLVLRERIRKHELLGPRLVLSRMIDGAGKAWPPPLGVWINNPDEARQAVIDAHQQGYDRIKVYSFLDRASYDTIMTTAKGLGMPVDGHVPFATSVEHVIASGQKMIAHVEEVMKFAKDYSPRQVEYYADLLARSDLWVTSSLILNRNLNAMLRDSASQFSKLGVEYLHPMASELWSYVYQHLYKPIPGDARQKLIDGYDHFQRPFVREFTKRGGKLLAGTDALVPSTLPGRALHEELEELVSAGVRPFDALKASTTNPFAFLDESNRAGTVEPGKVANLLLLEGNPLEDISRTRAIVGVMTQDHWIPRTEIDLRLRQIADRFGQQRQERAALMH